MFAGCSILCSRASLYVVGCAWIQFHAVCSRRTPHEVLRTAPQLCVAPAVVADKLKTLFLMKPALRNEAAALADKLQASKHLVFWLLRHPPPPVTNRATTRQTDLTDQLKLTSSNITNYISLFAHFDFRVFRFFRRKLHRRVPRRHASL